MKRIAIGLLALVVLVVGGVVVYVQLIAEDAPPKLTFTDEGSAATTTGGTSGTDDTTAGRDLDGEWSVGEGTEVRYRVREDFIGGLQGQEAVGATDAVTGALTIAGTQVPEATFTVDVTTLESDRSQRDNQVQGRILDTAQFPEARFALTEPIDVGAVPPADEEITASATGDLELRGTTREVTFDVRAKRVGDHIEILGEIPIVFADYGIPNPSNPVVSTEDHGLLEFRLVLTRA